MKFLEGTHVTLKVPKATNMFNLIMKHWVASNFGMKKVKEYMLMGVMVVDIQVEKRGEDI